MVLYVSGPGGNPLPFCLAGVLLFVVTSAMIMFFNREVFRSLGGIVTALERAAEGDLSVRVDEEARWRVRASGSGL